MPVMDERKRLWRAVHDLKMERPMILVETASVDGFVSSDELRWEEIPSCGLWNATCATPSGTPATWETI